MAEELVQIGNVEKKFRIFEEGKVKIAFDENAETFYNPVQEFNRDLTLVFL